MVDIAPSVQNLTRAANNFTSGLVLNTTNLGLKSAVAALETAEPLFRVGKAVNDQLSKVAQASSKVAADLAQRSNKILQDRIAAMPAGKAKDDAKAAAAEIRKNAGSSGSSTGQQAAQMGRRRMLH